MIRGRILLTLLAIAATAACSNGLHPGTQALDAGGVSVLVLNENFEGASGGVGIFGSLQLVGHRCVGFAMGNEPTLLVFPPDTSVTGSGASVVIHVQGTSLRLADHFSGGSTFNEPKSLSLFGDLGTEVPSSCRRLRAVAFEPDHA
jgi:hypothetical protein